MSKAVKQEARPDEVNSGGGKQEKRFVGQRGSRFQGSCNELRGYVFDVANLRALDRFKINKDKVARVVAVKLNFGMELKRAIEKLEKIEIEKPTPIAETADALEKAIFAKEVKEYIRNKQLLKEMKKQAYVLLWGQCSRATHEKLRTQDDFATVEDEED
eukprot:10096743-Ditylum_brightwellii.AAC.1